MTDVIKSALVGLGAAGLAVIAWIAGSVSISVGAGVGSAAVAFDTAPVALVAMVGFILGFAFHRRREGARHR